MPDDLGRVGPLMRRVLAYAGNIADELGYPSIGSAHILCGAVAVDSRLSESLLLSGVSLDCLLGNLGESRSSSPSNGRLSMTEVAREALRQSGGGVYDFLRELSTQDPEFMVSLRHCSRSLATPADFIAILPSGKVESKKSSLIVRSNSSPRAEIRKDSSS